MFSWCAGSKSPCAACELGLRLIEGDYESPYIFLSPHSLLLFYPPNPTAFHLGVTKKLLKIEALDEEQGSGT